MRRSALAFLVLLGPILAACSSNPATSQIAGLSPTQAVAKSCEASLAAGGVTATSQFSPKPGLRGSMDFTFNGAMSQGSLTLGKQGRADEVATAKAMYLRGNSAFWKTMLTGLVVPDKVLTAMNGKWLRINTKGYAQGVRASLLRWADPQELLKACSKQFKGFTAAGSGKVEDQPVQRFTATGAPGTTAELAISDRGEPYVLAMAVRSAASGPTSPASALSVRYDNYGATLDVQAPTPSYDLSPILATLAALSTKGLPFG